MKYGIQIMIIVLVALLLSAVGGAFYFYKQSKENLITSNKLVNVFTANKNLKKNTKIDEDDLKQVKMAKKFLLIKPLLKTEIVGKILTENIYKNEMFIKEKITSKIEKFEELIAFKKNSYNMGFNLFSNPNFSLKKGDYINLISVYPEDMKKDNMDFEVQYVAETIKVLGFLEKGNVVNNCFKIEKRKVEKKKRKTTNKNIEYENVKVFADEIVLDIDDKTILSIINDYNKGKQLWMVKTNKKITTNNKTIVTSKKEITATKRKFSLKLYQPKTKIEIRKVLIQYSDLEDAGQTKQVFIESPIKKHCKQNNKTLVTLSKTKLRKYASLKAPIQSTVDKNYLLPYKKLVHPQWYEICDGTFVHNETVSIHKEVKDVQ